MSSGTDHTSSEMSEFCLQTPFCFSVIAACVGWPIRDRRRDRRGRRAVLDVLAERPRALFGAFGKLQVAPRHVEAASVAVDGAERVVDLAIRKAGAPIATTSSTSKWKLLVPAG